MNSVYGEADPNKPDVELPLRDICPDIFRQGDAVSQSYRSKESGGIHSFDLNGALNFMIVLC